MKNLFFAAMLLNIFTLSSQAQAPKNYFTLAVKGGYGSSLLMDKNLIGNADVTPDFIPSAYFFGGKLGINFTENVGIMFEVLQNTFGQEFDVNATVPFHRKIDMTALSFPVLFRYTTSNDLRMYEIGIKYASLTGVTQTTTTDNSTVLPADDGDMSANFNSGYLSLVAGIGTAFIKADNFDFNWTLRFDYALGNVLKDNKYPFKDALYTPQNPEEPMNPLSVSLVMEFNYYFGYFSKSGCGRVQFLFF